MSEVATDNPTYHHSRAAFAKKILALGIIAIGGVAAMGWIAFLVWSIGKLLSLT